MPTIQNLKKKLQVIHSTKKITQAMKTASTVKYSKLAALYADFSKYEEQCSTMYKTYREDINSIFSSQNTDAPELYVLLSSNKGMCGNFNTDVLGFFEKKFREQQNQPIVFCCGKKGVEYLDKKRIPYNESFVFDDIPSVSVATEFFEKIIKLIENGVVSDVKIIYPKYVNTMKQYPVCEDLLTFDDDTQKGEDPLFVPDKQTVIHSTAEKILVSILYRKILETALGAQAATLTTMRSAYDTACEYSDQLEIQINRKRQSQVTADVIEISSEYSMAEEG